MEFSGRLASFSMADLLSWANNERRTGSLVVRRTRREKRIFFEEGHVVACLSDDPAEFYGQHLLLNGHLDEETLFECLTLCREKHKRLGTVLAEQGILDLATIQQTLRQLIEERICGLFLWRNGVFFFEAEDPPKEEILADPIDTLALTLEGARWVDEFRRLSEVLPHDSVILTRGPGWPGENLSPLESRVVPLVDGQMSLEQMYEQVKGSYFQFLSAVYGLVEVGIVEAQDAGGTLGTGSVELNLYDLMFEQAAEEQILTSRNHIAIPLTVVESYVPVWANRPAAEDWERMPQRVQKFYDRFDGQRRLRDLFSSDRQHRQREVELLLLQMRKGNLALLPTPLGDLDAAADQSATPTKQRWWKKLFTS